MKKLRDISSVMRQVHSRDTGPEKLFRKALRQAEITYRLKNDDLPGKPDLTIPKVKIAVFIDGDYWHGGQWIRRGLTCLEDQFKHNSNTGYWLKKIRNNMRRDVRATRELLDRGWKVLRLWESTINSDVNRCLRIVQQACQPDCRFGAAESVIPYKTVAEFFAGIGLVRLGLESNDWRIVYANDVDINKRQMYFQHFGHEPEKFDLRDIKQVKSVDIPDVTMATASFPCNDTSLAGSRKGLDGEKSSTFWSFMKLLGQMESRRPPLVLVENVTGFLTSKNGRDFELALTGLNDLGYLVDTFQIDASYFVPQSRKRLFIVAVLEDLILDDPSWLGTEVTASVMRPKRLAEFISAKKNIKWLIRRLPNTEKCGSGFSDIIEDLEETNAVWWSRARAEYLLGQMNATHRSKARKMIDGKDFTYGTVFRRVRNGVTMAELRTDGLAGCLRTPRGGSARQILFKGGKGVFQVRLLTSRECAGLMGAADYRIEVPESQALYGFGDAVVVPVIEWISKYYLDPLINQLLRGRVFAPQNVN